MADLNARRPGVPLESSFSSTMFLQLNTGWKLFFLSFCFLFCFKCITFSLMCSSWFSLLAHWGTETNVLSRNRVPTLLLIILLGNHFCGKAGSPAPWWREKKIMRCKCFSQIYISFLSNVDGLTNEVDMEACPQHAHEFHLNLKSRQPVTDTPLGAQVAFFRVWPIHGTSTKLQLRSAAPGRRKSKFAFQDLLVLLFSGFPYLIYPKFGLHFFQESWAPSPSPPVAFIVCHLEMFWCLLTNIFT